MPQSPHLEFSHCGYTLLNLAGLSPDITARDVERITINGIEQEFRAWRHRIVMVVPGFKQEAQAIKVYCEAEAEPLRAYLPMQARPAPPGPMYGLQPRMGPRKERQ
jgi:hypothetical protein